MVHIINLRPFLIVALTIATSGLLSGCATDQKATMQSWMGKPKDQLIVALGSPDNVTKLGDGGELLEYVRQYQSRVYDGHDVETTPSCNPVSQTTGTVKNDGSGTLRFDATTRNNQNCINFSSGYRPKYHYETETCRKRFKANNKGILVAWSFEGC